MKDIYQIMKILPHRYPFLMVDRIIEEEALKRVVGVKNVTVNEPFFMGHFPGEPIMPGTLIIEAMAQIGGFVFDIENSMGYVVGVNNAKFIKKVLPGDVLEIEANFIVQMGNVGKVKATARVDNKTVAMAEITYSFIERK